MNRAVGFAGVVWLAVAVAAYADQNKPPKKQPAPPKNPPPPAAKVETPHGPNPGGGGGGAPKAPRLPNVDNPVLRLRAMTPEQRERVLERLQPKQQENIRKALENFDKQPEAQKERQMENLKRLWSLPADKQQVVKEQINAYNALPEERKQALRQPYVRLSRATPQERAEILSRPQFQSRFSPEELQMLTVLPEYWPLR
jgi:hypothetical protein